MRFVLVHGWGFHAGIWTDFIRHLPDDQISLVDLGFVAGGPKGIDEILDGAIAVGHSLGLLWLLQQEQHRFAGMVSIQGFDCFACHVPRAGIEAMRRGLHRDPAQVLGSFWRTCGLQQDFAPAEALNVQELEQGLRWLMRWDAREQKEALAGPRLVLAARDDRIVSEEMTKAVWNGTEILWSETGGHVLPLKRPEWCASHVLDFARTLGA